MRKDLRSQRVRRRMSLVATLMLASSLASAPRIAAAEGIFDFFFGAQNQRQQQQQQQQQQQANPAANFFADPFGLNQPAGPPTPRPAAYASSGPAFCVRSCDGRYFPLTARGGATPVQMCQAFCPTTATRVFSGSNIDGAVASNGQRYADSENAYAYRKGLRADCTCNGRDSLGLSPVDLSLDTSLRAGDVIATTTGLVAYSGIRLGASQTAEFTPVASYPGLTADVRTRLGEMKVAPVNADMVVSQAPEPKREVAPAPSAPKASPKAKRAEAE